MKITYHEEKRALVLEKRGLDLAHAGRVFSGATLTLLDDRENYGEERFQTIGFINETMLMVVWTPRGEARHIITMSAAHHHDEKVQCQRKEEISYPNGMIRMMPRSGRMTSLTELSCGTAM